METGFTYCKAFTLRIAIINPRSNDPLSPIKTFAGCQFKIKKAKITDISKALQTIRVLSLFINPITNIADKIIAEIEPAKPSNPSLKFTAFVKATIAKKVNGKTK